MQKEMQKEANNMKLFLTTFEPKPLFQNIWIFVNFNVDLL